MVARLQGWQDDWGWRFSGRKTARYRQIGNAFPGYRLGGFKAFLGQPGHARHERFAARRTTIS